MLAVVGRLCGVSLGTVWGRAWTRRRAIHKYPCYRNGQFPCHPPTFPKRASSPSSNPAATQYSSADDLPGRTSTRGSATDKDGRLKRASCVFPTQVTRRSHVMSYLLIIAITFKWLYSNGKTSRQIRFNGLKSDKQRPFFGPMVSVWPQQHTLRRFDVEA
ncbi:hypothetical protein FIBSPDRAFT_207737 [Athelia psychrophila]|uniref:Uncharacterized protein n=1 Tax=Athelia psychrophila TaxID=1759441 RepID=A0A166WL85_9AGAM|nr:hypothetical protein FIBSPDRAFT_207737 [Fibularhizoctonia sp. CBS 109695]